MIERPIPGFHSLRELAKAKKLDCKERLDVFIAKACLRKFGGSYEAEGGQNTLFAHAATWEVASPSEYNIPAADLLFVKMVEGGYLGKDDSTVSSPLDAVFYEWNNVKNQLSKNRIHYVTVREAFEMVGLGVETPPPPVPECDRMRGVANESQAIGNFLEWAEGQGMELCYFRGHEYQMVRKSKETLLAECYAIDLKQVEAERAALLEWVRAGQDFREVHGL